MSSDWFSIYTLVAFILGVLLSAYAKAAVAKLKGAASGATGA